MTRAKVLKVSSQQQTPWENSSIVEDFCFLPKAAPAGPAALPAQPEPAAAQPLASAKRAPAPTPTEVKLLESRAKGWIARWNPGLIAPMRLAQPIAAITAQVVNTSASWVCVWLRL